MSALPSLRRTAVGVAASVLLVGGVLGFAVVAGNAGAEVAAPAAVPAGAIALNNNQATAQSDCPDDGLAYWHFILAPNNGTYAFTVISLELTTTPGPGSEIVTFTGPAIVPNGSQTDNVFVAVPAGHTLTDIVLGDSSYALYSGGSSAPSNFTLSHTCAGTVETTTTSSTTSTIPTSTTKVTTSTTSTTVPETTTTTVPETTTTTVPETTTTTEQATTTTEAEVLGTVQTTSTTAAEAATAVQTGGDLPYTGTDTAGLVMAGLSVLLGGGLLVGLARTKNRTLGEQ